MKNVPPGLRESRELPALHAQLVALKGEAYVDALYAREGIKRDTVYLRERRQMYGVILAELGPAAMKTVPAPKAAAAPAATKPVQRGHLDIYGDLKVSGKDRDASLYYQQHKTAIEQERGEMLTQMREQMAAEPDAVRRYEMARACKLVRDL